MSHSLNEIEALSKRAARGAGLSWGMAEEAGRAVRWLASHDLPGVALLADLLTGNDQVPHKETAPISLDGVWRAPSGVLCPLASGAALNDCADRLEPGQSIEMANVSHPLLAVPFAAWAAIHIGAPVRVCWAGVSLDTDGYGIWRMDAVGLGETMGGEATSLTCTRAPVRSTGSTEMITSPALRGFVSEPGWSCLARFAGRTYAPATAESRRLGAGAGVTDND